MSNGLSFRPRILGRAVLAAAAAVTAVVMIAWLALLGYGVIWLLRLV